MPSVYFYLNYFSQKGPSVLCGVLLWAWWSAFCGSLICNEDETADDHTLSNTPPTSVGCTLAPEDLEDRRPTTTGIGHCRINESMPTSGGVGSYAAIAYDKRWYVASVTDVQDGVFGVLHDAMSWKTEVGQDGRRGSGGE